MSAPETAAALRERLEAADAPPGAVEAAIRYTAPQRHRWRTSRALEAALVAAGADAAGAAQAAERYAKGDLDWHCSVQRRDRARAWALLALEAVGLGGRAGLEGLATDRPDWCAGLGKGRRNASDGAAWTAALADARHALEGEIRAIPCGRPLRLVPAPGALAVERSRGPAGWEPVATLPLGELGRVAGWSWLWVYATRRLIDGADDSAAWAAVATRAELEQLAARAARLHVADDEAQREYEEDEPSRGRVLALTVRWLRRELPDAADAHVWALAQVWDDQSQEDHDGILRLDECGAADWRRESRRALGLPTADEVEMEVAHG